MANDTSTWKASFQVNGNGWNGAAVAPIARSGLRLISDGMAPVVPEAVPDQAIGDGFIADEHMTRQRGSGSIGELYARYEGIERLLAFACGQDTITGVGPYDHEFFPLSVLGADAVFQYILDKNEGFPWVWDSNVLSGFELKLSDGLLTLVPSVVTSTMKRTNLAFTAHTVPTEGLVLNMNDAVLRMNVSGGAGLASPADLVPFSDFSFSFQRSMEGDPVNNADGTDDLPGTTGFPETTFSVSGPSLESTLDAIITSSLDATGADNAPVYMKADLIFTGPSPRIFTLEMPKMKILNPEAIGPGGHQKVPTKIEFRCLRSATVPTNMFANFPFRIFVEGVLVNTDPLA